MKYRRLLSMVLAYVLAASLSMPVSATELSAPVTDTVSGSDVMEEVVEEEVLETFDASQADVESVKTVLQLNKAAGGVLTDKNEWDWYSFDITQRGYFQVELKASASADVEEIDDGWNMYIYKQGDLSNAIKVYNGITTRCLTAHLPMEAGTYYVLVCSNNSYSDYYAPTGCPYEIKANFVASNAWEVEANDSNTTYNTISVNKDYQGTLYHAKDVDWYRVNTSAAGTIHLVLNGDVNNDTEEIDDGWHITIYDKDFNELKSYSSITGNTTTQVLPFAKGTFYIKLQAQNSYSDYYAPTDCIYHLQMKFTASSAWESEYNESNATADTISTNKTYSGLLYHAKDEDWYKVTINTQGYFQVQFNVPNTVNVDDIDDGWAFTVYDKDLNEIRSYTGITGNYTTPVLPFAKGTYYIKLRAQNSYSDYYAPTDCVYKLKVKTTKSSAWESEYNDNSAKADVISPNKKYSGIFHHAKDEDWYKVKVTTQGYFQVQFTVSKTINMDDINDGWKIMVYDKDFNEIKTYSDITSSTNTHVFPYAKGTYYVKISPDNNYSDYYAPTNCIYSFKVKTIKSSYWESEYNNEIGKADSIKLNKKYSGIFTHCKDGDWYKATVSATGVLQVKLNKASGTKAEDIHNGWDVYVYRNSMNSQVAKLTAVKSSDSVKIDVKKGKYYIYVCPNNSYSDYYAPTNCTYNLSTKFTKTPGAATISSATGGKKQVTLKWKKVTNATGYEIYRSTKKNGKYKKVATIKNGSTVKYVDKKLKAKTTYYYKIKAYTTTNDLKAVGKFSKVKSAKTKK